MKAKELRIGNLIFGVSDRIEEVVCLWPSLVCIAPPLLKSAESCHAIWDINGIPLTEEWLTKCGFKNTYDSYWESDEMYFYELLPNNKEKTSWTVFDVGGNKFPYYLEYVHQLQNLYYAIEGRELCIK